MQLCIIRLMAEYNSEQAEKKRQSLWKWNQMDGEYGSEKKDEAKFPITHKYDLVIICG